MLVYVEDVLFLAFWTFTSSYKIQIAPNLSLFHLLWQLVLLSSCINLRVNLNLFFGMVALNMSLEL